MTAPRRWQRRFRYGPWQGGPDPLAAPFDVRPALEALGDEVLAGGSLRDALRELLRRGLPGQDQRGLDALRAQAARLRREAARRGRLDGTLTRVAAKLDQALAAERAELAGRDGDPARFAESRLDNLPRSTAAAVSELSQYDWTSPQAAELYREILDELRQDVLDQRFRGIRDALSQLGPDGDGKPGSPQRQQANQAVKDMLADLNRLLAASARGEDTTAAFEQFIAQHGDLFPENPQSVDELVDALARRAAAAERLMASLTPEQQQELAGLMAAALGDPDLAAAMAELNDNLRALRPDLAWDRPERIRGETPLGYGQAAGALQEIADLDDLLDQLGQDHPGATLDDIDVETVERTLGAGAGQDVRRLQQLERELERQGWVTRGVDGLSLSPKALRQLGQTALRKVFEQLSARGRGEHDVRDAGAAGEPTGSSREWRFGDEQPLDVVRTVGNAVRRTAVAPSPAGRPRRAVQLSVEDFEVADTERRAGASVALCVDLSYSMIAEGRWGPMKQTALALAQLAATQYPQDALEIIGFGRHAAKLTLEQLAGVEPDLVQGTNLQHALKLAGRHLRRHPDGEPVVLVVTDGEPTAHLSPDGGAVFNWPPTRATIEATVAEVDLLTRYGAAINLFMLGEDPGLRRFVDAVARRNGGRVFSPGPDRLGQFVVADYLRARRGRRQAG